MSWATDIVQAMKRSGEMAGQPLLLATIEGLQPVSIRTHGLTINQNIYINPSLLYHATELEHAFQYDSPFIPSWFSFLKQFFNLYLLKSGDTVIVLQSEESFYILAKVGGL